MLTLQKHHVTGPLGLDFGQERLHLVQLDKRSGRCQVRAYASIAYPESRDALTASPKALKALLTRTLKENAFSGRRIATALPSDKLKMILLNYQISARDGDAEAIIKLLGERLEGDLGEYVIDYLPIRTPDKDSNQRVALVASAKRQVVIGYLELFRKAGFVVEALEIGPVAIQRLVGELQTDEKPESVVVINFGRCFSFLTVLSGRRLVFDHELGLGEEKLIGRVSEHLELEPNMVRRLLYNQGVRANGFKNKEASDDQNAQIAETLTEILKPSFIELVEEMNRALIYTASEIRGQPVQRVYLLGGIAHWPGVDHWLNELIQIPVSLLNPLAHFVESDSPEPLPGLAVATGLALRGLTAYG